MEKYNNLYKSPNLQNITPVKFIVLFVNERNFK